MSVAPTCSPDRIRPDCPLWAILRIDHYRMPPQVAATPRDVHDRTVLDYTRTAGS